VKGGFFYDFSWIIYSLSCEERRNEDITRRAKEEPILALRRLGFLF